MASAALDHFQSVMDFERQVFLERAMIVVNADVQNVQMEPLQHGVKGRIILKDVSVGINRFEGGKRLKLAVRKRAVDGGVG